MARGRLRERLRAVPGRGEALRGAGDVRVDTAATAAAAAGGPVPLPRLGGGLTVRRRIAGALLALVAGPLLTGLLVSLRSDESITSDVLSYQLLVVVVALVGGLWPALLAAVLSGLTLDFFFIEPLRTIEIDDPLHALAIVLYVVSAVLVSYVVDHAARRSTAARRAAAESQFLATVAGGVLRGEDALEALVHRIREAFGLDGVRLVSGGEVLAADGAPSASSAPGTAGVVAVPVGERAVLEISGRPLDPSDRRLLAVVTTQLEATLDYRAVAATAETVEPLAEADRVRSALLSAVSHDLRRPLASATAAVGALRATDVRLSDAQREELLATADESLGALTSLVTNLLDVSRLQAGVLAVVLSEVDMHDVVLTALDELDLGPAEVELALPATSPTASADVGLLERVVVNILANALRFSPADRRVLITSSVVGSTVELRVVDHGPGVAAERRDEIFLPFQRLGDTDNRTGLGLGLALARGLVEGMGGTLDAEDTLGGGLTMVVSLPAAGRGRMDA
jgi:two-component system sensor histidine kinase KdpD